MGRVVRVAAKAFDQGAGTLLAGSHPRQLITSMRTSTGRSATYDRALTIAAYFGGIRVIAEDVASLPFIVYERQGEGRVRARTHPLYRLLHDAPNPEMTSMVWRETSQVHLLTWGNAYSEIQYNGNGVPVALWPLDPSQMEVRRVAGKLAYRYTAPGFEPLVLDRRHIFHVPGIGFDGRVGYSILHVAREALAIASAHQEYEGRFYANDARPGVYLKHPGKLSQDAIDHLEASWNEAHAGLSNAHRTAVLEEGLDVATIGIPQRDAEFLGSKRQSLGDIGRYLRLAPHKLGDFERATFSNIEETNIDHAQSALRSWLVRWEQQANKDLLALSDRYYTEHLIDALVRGNLKSRYEAFSIGRMGGFLTEDDIRQAENLNQLTEEQRGTLLLPLSHVPASTYDEDGMTAAQRSAAAAQLVRAGFDPASTLEALGLPPIAYTGRAPAAAI